MANHFTNDRPTEGPKTAKFGETSPENQDFPKNRVPKMGKIPNPRPAQKWHFGTFGKIPEIPEIWHFPLSGTCPELQIARSCQILSQKCSFPRKGRYFPKYRLPDRLLPQILTGFGQYLRKSSKWGYLNARFSTSETGSARSWQDLPDLADLAKSAKTAKSENLPDLQISRSPDVQIARSPDLRNAKFSEIPEFPEISEISEMCHFPEIPEFRKSGFPTFQIPKSQNLQICQDCKKAASSGFCHTDVTGY